MVRNLAILAAILCLAGCVERKLLIRSDPEGATIVLNRDLALPDPTPCTFAFDQYGTWAVSATKEGHRDLETAVEVSAPWWAYFPFDFITDVLLPFTIEDHRLVALTLSPLPPLRPVEEVRESHAEIVERGEEMRRRVNEGDPAEVR